MSKNKIYIIDVTNRDGVQTSRICLSKLQKTMINLYLNEMGIYQSEFGFPVTHHETNYLNANLELAKMGVLKPIILEGWIRAIPEDVEAATAGEYSGIKGFRNVYEKLEIKFHDEKEATEILELVRYANVQTQKPLVEDELRFIAKYPEIARKIFTMTP